MADELTPDEMRELSKLFSSLIGNIHTLPPARTAALLDVDERMRGDSLTKEDLKILREIAAHIGR